MPGQKNIYQIPTASRDQFVKSDVLVNRDFVLSPDRALFAFASDDGIEFFDAKSKKKLGATPTLSKYGTKLELIGMGFDPAKSKLAIYFSALKAEGLVK